MKKVTLQKNTQERRLSEGRITASVYHNLLDLFKTKKWRVINAEHKVKGNWRSLPIWFLNSCGTVLWERKLAWQNYQKNWQVYAKTPKMLSESFVTINYVYTLRGSYTISTKTSTFCQPQRKNLTKTITYK